MNRRQENFFTMTRATIACMESERTTWESIPPVNNVMTNLSGLVNTVSTVDKSRNSLKTEGLTADKNQVFETMCQRALKLASKMKAYAKINSNNALLVAVDYTPTSLEAGSESATLTRCENILEKAREFAGSLAEYQVNDADLTALETSINDFKPLTAGRDLVADERVAKTTKISETLMKIRAQLDILDDLVEGIFDEEFIDVYESARQITDR